MGFAGRLEGIAPSDIFQIISQGKMTGTLIARCPDGTGMVVFKNGQVIEAASDAPRESLGNLLVSQGMLSATALAEAMARQKREPDTPLGMILVEMEAISSKALEGVVLRQIEQIVHRLVSCEDGFITFDRGEMALKRKLNTHEFLLPSGVSPEYLLLEDARTLDEGRREVIARPASAGARSPRADGEPAGLNQENPQGDVAVLKSMFHEIRLPKPTDGSGTWVRRVTDIAAAMGGRIQGYLARTAESVDGKLRSSLPEGRTMALAGIVTIAVSIVLIGATSLSFQSKTTGSVLVVSKHLVNIREKPSADSAVVAQAKKGDSLSYITSVGKWHKVVAPGGVGWISQYMGELKDRKKLAVSYDMKGYELVFAAGLALLLQGIVRKKKSP